MTHRYAFIQVDVFTQTPFGGNQLAVFTDARGLSGEQMQALAREMNFSETTFVLPPVTPGAQRRVKIYTPAVEMPVAGHPTVGTAFVLSQRGLVDLPGGCGEMVLDLGIGPVSVSVEKDAAGYPFIWMTHRPAEFGPVREDGERVANALKIRLEDLDPRFPIQQVSTGAPFLFVPLRNLDAATRCRPDETALGELFQGIPAVNVYMFTTQTTSPQTHIHSRMFAPHTIGIPEDPATGVAAAPLGAYLARYGLFGSQPDIHFVIEQGIEMKRPSQIHVEVQREGAAIIRLRIGGTAVIVGEGEMFWE